MAGVSVYVYVCGPVGGGHCGWGQCVCVCVGQ